MRVARGLAKARWLEPVSPQAWPQVRRRARQRALWRRRGAAAALVAWDRYLADFPASSFATDARFNRALCLLRLGQSADARRALEVFAGAAPGSYLQRDAAALLEGLEAAAASLTAAPSQ